MKFEIKSDDMHTRLFINGEDITDHVKEFSVQQSSSVLNVSIAYIHGIPAGTKSSAIVSGTDCEAQKQCQYSLTKPKPPKRKWKLFRIKR